MNPALSDALEIFGAAPRAGRPIRIAIVDSGIHATHPHIQGVSGGVSLIPGSAPDDHIDRNGHGTAVAAAIREKCPSAELFAVKIFDADLMTTATLLVSAIEWAAESEMDLVNLSLGTTNLAHASTLQRVVHLARAAGVVIVAAADQDGVRSLPGALKGVVAVSLDWECPRETCMVDAAGPDGLRIRASGYPRPIPDVPPAKNLKGISFAVANATGIISATLSGV